jgi:hypothetical protein
MTLFSLEASHNYASHTPQQESDLVKKMRDTSGRRCLERFGRFNHVGLWAKTFSDLLIGQTGWFSTKCKLTWKLKGTKYNRMYFQLYPSTHHTEGTESGLLPTPSVADIEGSPKRIDQISQGQNGTFYRTSDNTGTRFGAKLNDVARLLPTPRTSDKNMHWRTENWKGDDLGSHINEMFGTRSHLSPQFVLEMMGFPTDWTLLPFLSGETNQSKQEEMQ